MLAYFAVSEKSRTVELARKNIDHLRRSLANHCRVEVFLNHYEPQELSSWDREGKWYTENVRFSTHVPGNKIQSMRTNYKTSWTKYTWVWALDEDGDITMTDVLTFLRYADESGALLAIPAFTQEGNTPEERMLSSPHQYPVPTCLYRYVPMIEVIFPLIRPIVLDLLFVQCPDCIRNTTTWGLSDVWCGYAAHELLTGREEGKRDGADACVVVDATPMVHKNFKNLKNKYIHGKKDPRFTPKGKADSAALRKEFPTFFVKWRNVTTKRCVKRSALQGQGEQ